MQVLKRFSSWRPNGKVDELQHWTEQTRQQSRFNAVPTCCRVSHIISQIFMEFYIEYQEKPWLYVIISFSQLIEPIILNHVKYPFRLHLQSWVCIRIRYQLNYRKLVCELSLLLYLCTLLLAVLSFWPSSSPCGLQLLYFLFMSFWTWCMPHSLYLFFHRWS